MAWGDLLIDSKAHESAESACGHGGIDSFNAPGVDGNFL